MYLPRRMVVAKDVPWQSWDGVLLVIDVANIRDMCVDVICEGLVSNLGRLSSIIVLEGSVVDSYHWHTVADRLENDRRWEMQR